MTTPTNNQVNDVLARLEAESKCPRVSEPEISPIRRSYNFLNAPVELRQIVYDATVRFHCRRSLLSRLWRRG